MSSQSIQRRRSADRICVFIGAAGMTLLASVMVIGCGSRRLETGYRYRPLNSTSVERRAFYADLYSIEAEKAAAQKNEDSTGPLPPGIGR